MMMELKCPLRHLNLRNIRLRNSWEIGKNICGVPSYSRMLNNPALLTVFISEVAIAAAEKLYKSPSTATHHF